MLPNSYKILEESLPINDKYIISIMFNYFRLLKFEDKGLKQKPILLMIPTSVNNGIIMYRSILNIIKNISVSDFVRIKKFSNNGIVKVVFDYFERNKVDFETLYQRIKDNYSEESILVLSNFDFVKNPVEVYKKDSEVKIIISEIEYLSYLEVETIYDILFDKIIGSFDGNIFYYLRDIGNFINTSLSHNSNLNNLLRLRDESTNDSLSTDYLVFHCVNNSQCNIGFFIK